MSILRIAVLLAVVGLFFPSTPEEKEQAYRGVATAVEQVSTFCVRNDALCEKSKFLASEIYDRVKIGAEILFEAARGTHEDDSASNRSSRDTQHREHRRRPAEAERRSSLERSADTLRREDRAPAWRGPGAS